MTNIGSEQESIATAIIKHMELPKFSIGSLVSYNDQIHEVKNFKSSPNGYLYTLEIKAFLRDKSDKNFSS